ncbi:MAG TPA: cytochrome P450 [Ignavibacteriaceae bacterium]
MLSKRKEETKKYNDFLQLMINANKKQDSEELENDSINNEAIYGQSDETEIVFNKSKVEITEDDILATSFLFFIAGFETTASLLSFLFYSLALDQKCQQKLYEEVVSFKGKLDYESIAQMSYLDACIAETLRLYNPVLATSRIASEDYVLGIYHLYYFLMK